VYSPDPYARLFMATPASLIPELEDAISNGSAERRTEMLRRITNLFVDGANNFNEDHVGVFDDVLVRLITEIETKTLAELSHRLSPVDNAPIQLMRRLAGDDDIRVAGPVLKQSKRLDENDLVDIANTKGAGHLLAISGRNQIAEAVTDILVRRGDQDVVRSVANNQGAKLSEASFAALVGRAETDDVLAERVGLRADVPVHLFRRLVAQATEVVQSRLLAASRPEVQSEIKRVLVEVSQEVGIKAAPMRDYTTAQQTALDMRRQGTLDEKQIARFAREGQFEQMTAALSALCAVPLDVVERLLTGDRIDPVLILCRAIGFGWPTVRTIIVARPDRKAASSQKLDDSFSNYERLSQATAQRVVRFWQVRRQEVEAP
jgi:uncharacterized protein (DUF2336 family)